MRSRLQTPLRHYPCPRDLRARFQLRDSPVWVVRDGHAKLLVDLRLQLRPASASAPATSWSASTSARTCSALKRSEGCAAAISCSPGAARPGHHLSVRRGTRGRPGVLPLPAVWLAVCRSPRPSALPLRSERDRPRLLHQPGDGGRPSLRRRGRTVAVGFGALVLRPRLHAKPLGESAPWWKQVDRYRRAAPRRPFYNAACGKPLLLGGC